MDARHIETRLECRVTAGITGVDGPAMRDIIEREGFVTAMEPTCGSGAMIIALADTMRAADINYQRQLHVTAVDIDRRAVHMCYVQLSLLHIPAEMIVGNSLSLEVKDCWHAPPISSAAGPKSWLAAIIVRSMTMRRLPSHSRLPRRRSRRSS